MFPTADIRWKPFPTIMDGMKAPPFVFNNGMWHGVLHLAVVEALPGTRAYGVEIACEVFAGWEEMIHSVAGYGAPGVFYDGDVFLKEAENSALLDSFRAADPGERPGLRHFLFVGGDFCIETLGTSEPVIHMLESREAAFNWSPRKLSEFLK